MPERPDLPREGPDGRLASPRAGSNGADPAPWSPHSDGDRRLGGPLPPPGPRRTAAVIPVAAALVAAGALVDLGSSTNDFAAAVGNLDPDLRTVSIASYTAVLLVTLVEVGVAVAAVAARRSPRWWAAGWGALLALGLYRALAAAPVLFGELSVETHPAPIWRLAVDAATAIIAAVVCLAAPPVGDPR